MFFTPNAILSINGDFSVGRTFTGARKLRVQLNSGDFYLIYASQPVNAEWTDMNRIVVKQQTFRGQDDQQL